VILLVSALINIKACVLCSTDTIAALTIVKERQFPVLNSVLFGEGVINDAVTILLYNTINLVVQETEGDKFTLSMV
jgi:NhaP-type Na+/H+ or K+/H+ antiporter